MKSPSLENIEAVYKLLGTLSQPTEERDNLVAFIHTYAHAANKVKKFNKYKKELEQIFAKYPHLEDFNVFIEMDNSQEYYLSDLTVSQDVKDFELIEDDITDILCYDQDFLECLHYNLVNGALVVNKKNLHDCSTRVLNKDDLKIFNLIENFEKNKLEKDITPAKKYKKTPKL